ncbi:WD40 repeat-like protein [Atractiella rhizophila]|nr:WD40 repeat-like protein [Atractiella rhizophila]
MEFQKTLPKRHATGLSLTQQPKAKESHQWRLYRSPIYLKFPVPVSSFSLTSSPSPTNLLALPANLNLYLLNPKNGKTTKTITRFKDVLKSVGLRKDGKLVAVGDEKGAVGVWETERGKREMLRGGKVHDGPINSISFSPVPTSTTILTASSDNTAALFDLPTAAKIATFKGHTDYVKSACFLPTDHNLILTGSYDGTARLWDARIQQGPEGEQKSNEVAVFNHGQPVEAVLVHPKGTLAITAGGAMLKVWDLMSFGTEEGNGEGTSGPRCIKTMRNHQKTVTCLTWNGDATRLLSGGLDGLVKVYDVEENWKVRHTIRYGGQILSLQIAEDDSCLLCGSADGSLSIRRRLITPKEKAERAARAAAISRGDYDSFLKGQSQTGIHSGASLQEPIKVHAGVERTVRRQKKQKLKEWDRFLKSFRYGEALNAALQKGVLPPTTFAVLLELIHRDGLHSALASRDDVSLEPILSFLLRHVTDPRYCVTTCDVATVLIEIYTPVLGQSPVIDDLFRRLWKKVADELQVQKELTQVRGALDMILANTA